MIPPISSEPKNVFLSGKPTPPSPLSSQMGSTLHSMKPATVIETLSGYGYKILNLLFRFFKYLRDFIFGEARKENPIDTKNIQEDTTKNFSPQNLASQDPFRNLVFTFPEDGTWEFKDKRGFELAHDIFQRLGTGGPWEWFKQVNDISKAQEELQEKNLHPFELLYILFYSKLHTAYVTNFAINAVSSRLLTLVLRLTGRSDPWEEFLTRQENKFKLREKEKLLTLLPGFCKVLELNEETLRDFAKKQRWQELILHVFEERKKHFNFTSPYK